MHFLCKLKMVPPFVVWTTTNFGKFCLLGNLYVGQEATVRPRNGTMDWFKIGKGVHQGYVLSLCLFNLYAEYIMRNVEWNEIKIAG